MNLTEWAKREVEIACQQENPNRKEGEWDYGCVCYESALKAFNSLMEDDHSGFSFGITKDILIRLMNTLPLTPITDEDFVEIEGMPKESPENLKLMRLKSSIQCPRMPSLFRHETLDGKVTYSDVDRVIGVDVDKNYTYGCGGTQKYVDELFPIKMPYYPSTKKYRVYTQDFLLDKKNGEYDHEAYLYIVTPEGKEIRIDKYFKEVNRAFVNITKEEYEEAYKKRIVRAEDQ